MNKNTQLFVKFVPWNENTYRSLKNKTIKFSTAYELNDYNEFYYMAPDYIDAYEQGRDRIKKVVEKLFGDHSDRAALVENLKMSRYTSQSIKYFSEIFDDFQGFLQCFDRQFTDEDFEKWLRFLVENIAYTSVGIFSCSDIKIFQTPWAQLLYAYYADSLKGLALLYEQEVDKGSLINAVNYVDRLRCEQTNIGALRWAEKDFNDMGNFGNKLDIWKHEHELRIFDSPGVKPTSDFGIELKAVLHTQRIQDDLCKIREIIPKSVELKEIHAGYGSKSHLFKVDKDTTVFQWVESNFPQKKNFEIRELTDSDVDQLVSRFKSQRLEKPKSTFETYLAEQKSGERVCWVAYDRSNCAGYITLKWQSQYRPFQENNIPEIMDLNVLPLFRNKGIGSQLLDVAEKEAAERSSTIGIGVGLYKDYGAAQRLYVKRGYIPDGEGITCDYSFPKPGDTVRLDDDLVLWFTKKRL